MAPRRKARSLRFGYAGLRVRDLARSLAFYRGLGFVVHKRGRMEHGGRWVQLDYPGSRTRLELNYYPPGSRFYEPYRRGTEFDHLGFFTDEIDAWVARAKRLGGRLAVDLVEPNERLVYVKDPDGIWIEFCGKPPQPAR
jgi:catechol 2,3-dioxygenase-like lactoylglutathione lyase family enzyme